MNETELLRRLVEEPPARDDLAALRARQRLREQMAAESSQGNLATAASRAPRRRSRLVLAAFAGLVVAAFALQLVLPSGEGGPSDSAAHELVDLGRVAARARPFEIPAGSYLYGSVEEVHGQTTTQLEGASAPFTIVVHDTLQTWLSADGSGRQTTTFQDVSFASAADEQAWRQAGAPPLPQEGSTTQESYPAGGLLLYDLGSLPTQADALLAAIRAGQVDGAPADDFALLEKIGSVLAQGTASPQLREGLFDVAAGLPSIALDQHATDPIGRPGVGVALSSGGRTEELIFDPDSSALLATELRGADGDPASWQAFSDQGLVDSLGAKPQPTPFSAK